MGIMGFSKKYDENKLGIFQKFWDGQPNHLPFLSFIEDPNNKEWNLEISLRKIDEIFNANTKEDVISELSLLINKNNWRPQLLFCVSLFKLEKDEQLDFVRYLWDKLEENSSFVIPQLAVTVSIIDPNFNENAIEFLQKKNQDKPFEALEDEELLIELGKDVNKFDDKTRIVMGWSEGIKEILNLGKIKPALYKDS